MNTIGIIGNGKFGTLVQKLFSVHAPQMDVIMFNRNSLKVTGDIIIPAVPIREFEEVIKKISHQILPNSAVIDVCSVKEYPVQIMEKYLPEFTTIIATHPLFGPGTVSNVENIYGLKIVTSFIRGDKSIYKQLVSGISQIGLLNIEMSPKTHDKLMAESQFVSHVIANLLKENDFKKTNIDTNSATLLHEFEEMIQADSKLLKDMFEYNPYCREELSRFKKSYVSVMNLLQT